MKVLQINGYETPGKRFHGLGIKALLSTHGIESSHFVWERDTANEGVITCSGFFEREINSVINKIESHLSLQSMLHLNFNNIKNYKEFKEADLVHLHIIHSGFFRLSDLIELSKLKPTIWTFHDPWPMTGHCIYPLDCNRWERGCGSCPNLSSPFAIKKDTTSKLFEYKKKIYKNSNFDIIVASNWMI